MRRLPLFLLLLLVVACPTADDDDAARDDDDSAADDDDATDDPCADAVLGDIEACPAPSCLFIAEDRPDAPDGDYWLGGSAPALASCSLTDGGWLRLSLADADGVIVGEHSGGNAWDKCDDDTASHYQWIDGEDAVTPDISPGGSFQLGVDLVYAHPDSGETYTAAQVDGLRAPLVELDRSTRLVATTADDDSGNWQDGTGGGHEVYIIRSDGDWTLLTPGTNGDCGGGSGWPSEGSQSAFYVWSTDWRYSSHAGDTGDVVHLPRLEPGDLLPLQVYLAVQTGGGVSVGFEERVFRVR